MYFRRLQISRPKVYVRKWTGDRTIVHVRTHEVEFVNTDSSGRSARARCHACAATLGGVASPACEARVDTRAGTRLLRSCAVCKSRSLDRGADRDDEVLATGRRQRSIPDSPDDSLTWPRGLVASRHGGLWRNSLNLIVVVLQHGSGAGCGLRLAFPGRCALSDWSRQVCSRRDSRRGRWGGLQGDL